MPGCSFSQFKPQLSLSTPSTSTCDGERRVGGNTQEADRSGRHTSGELEGADPRPPVEAGRAKYSFVYQNVQSSGSTVIAL